MILHFSSIFLLYSIQPLSLPHNIWYASQIQRNVKKHRIFFVILAQIRVNNLKFRKKRGEHQIKVFSFVTIYCDFMISL